MLTSYVAAGKEMKYSERLSATTMTVTANTLGWDCCFLPLLWRRERFTHKRADVEGRGKETRGENTRRSASFKDTGLDSML